MNNSVVSEETVLEYLSKFLLVEKTKIRTNYSEINSIDEYMF